MKCNQDQIRGFLKFSSKPWWPLPTSACPVSSRCCPFSSRSFCLALPSVMVFSASLGLYIFVCRLSFPRRLAYHFRYLILFCTSHPHPFLLCSRLFMAPHYLQVSNWVPATPSTSALRQSSWSPHMSPDGPNLSPLPLPSHVGGIPSPILCSPRAGQLSFQLWFLHPE